MSREEEVQRLVQAAVERFRGLDIMVNNAGGRLCGSIPGSY